MTDSRICNNYFDENSPNFLVEYRGDFKGEIDKLDYACGDIITRSLGIISVPFSKLDRLINEVPAIMFVDFRSMYVLQEILPTSEGQVDAVINNPYLGLDGSGVLIGMVDTGIDYLNKEFLREDGTSRIVSIWDQTVQANNETVHVGRIYNNEEINAAILANKNNMNPYEIVETKDEIGHGTKMASIIGARGDNINVKGIASNSDFVVVKLIESGNYKKILRENGINNVPVYNSSEVLAGVEYLKKFSIKENRPMVIYIGVGTSEGSHDGNNLTSRYLTSVASTRGIVLVAGVGNQGDSEGHASGFIKNVGEVETVELNIPRQLKNFSFNIWVQRPNRMSINVVTPSGEISQIIETKINKIEKLKFYISNTVMTVSYFLPEHFTGNEVINIVFNDIKPGIWRFQLKSEYVTNGRYDIWLQPKNTLPEGTVFLKPDPYTTLAVPSTGRKVVTVAYYNSINNSLVSSSGKGFNTNGLINPDIVAAGINVLTTKVGGGVTTASGSSVATAIVSGACVLLLQWGIIDGNDTTMYSTKVRSYLIYGADRTLESEYPSKEIGYGKLDLLGCLKILRRGNRSNNYNEYYINNLFIRIPNN